MQTPTDKSQTATLGQCSSIRHGPDSVAGMLLSVMIVVVVTVSVTAVVVELETEHAVLDSKFHDRHCLYSW